MQPKEGSARNRLQLAVLALFLQLSLRAKLFCSSLALLQQTSKV